MYTKNRGKCCKQAIALTEGIERDGEGIANRPLLDSFLNLGWIGIDDEAAIHPWLLALFRVEVLCDANGNQAHKLILVNTKPVCPGVRAIKLEDSKFA